MAETSVLRPSPLYEFLCTQGSQGAIRPRGTVHPGPASKWYRIDTDWHILGVLYSTLSRVFPA